MSEMTVKPKRGPKEKSIEQLAREAKRGVAARPPATNGHAAANGAQSRDERLREQLRVFLAERGSELDDDDRAFAETIVHSQFGMANDTRGRVVLILARQQSTKVNGNGHAAAVAGPDLTPAETATTTPAGIAKRNGRLSQDKVAASPALATFREALRANRPVPKDLAAAAESGADVEIAWERLQPHPDNRDARDTDPDVVELAESIKTDRMLHAVTVRPTCKAEREVQGAKELEIIGGARRWRACRLAGLKTVRCKVRTDVDDAQALRYIAIENGKRKDLDPIQRAKLIERLCLAVAEGGAGLTLEAAAKDVGLQHGASASHLRRLLQLPQVWQNRVAAGELPESFARLLLPVLPLKAVMAQLEKEWKERGEPYDAWDTPNAFASREVLEGMIQSIIDDECRMVFPDRKDREAIDTSSAATQKTLGIVEMQLPTGGNRKLERVHVVTNVKAYEKLRNEQYARRTKSQAEKSGRDDKPAERERILSPAELKQREKQKAQQLAERIAGWRHRLLRRGLVEEIAKGIDSGLRLVLAYAAGPAGLPLYEVLCRVTKARSQQAGYRSYYWSAVAAVNDPEAEDALFSAMATILLQHETADIRSPLLPRALVDGYAADLKIDVGELWLSLQALTNGKPDTMVEDFFLLHQTEQLREVADELKVFLPPAIKTRAQIVKFLVGKISNSTRLPLPKSIKPLAIAAAPKAKKRGKGK